MFGAGGLFATQVLDLHGAQAAIVGVISGVGGAALAGGLFGVLKRSESEAPRPPLDVSVRPVCYRSIASATAPARAHVSGETVTPFASVWNTLSSHAVGSNRLTYARLPPDRDQDPERAGLAHARAERLVADAVRLAREVATRLGLLPRALVVARRVAAVLAREASGHGRGGGTDDPAVRGIRQDPAVQDPADGVVDQAAHGEGLGLAAEGRAKLLVREQLACLDGSVGVDPEILGRSAGRGPRSR